MIPSPTRPTALAPAPTPAPALRRAIAQAALVVLLAAVTAGATTARPARAQAPGDDGRVPFAVDDRRDLPDARPGDGVCAAAATDPPVTPCTLRAAVDEAGAGGRAAAIALPAGVYTLTLGARPPTGLAALAVPAGADIRLVGAGAAATVVALRPPWPAAQLGHMAVAAGGRLEVAGVTFRGGRDAGGFRVDGRLAMTDGAVVESQGSAPLLLVGIDGALAVTRTVIAANRTSIGISAWGPATVVSSTLQGNTFDDAAVHAYAAVYIASSAIAHNRVGGVTRGSGAVALVQSTVAGNEVVATVLGSALLGGGRVALEHATVAGNRWAAGSPRFAVVAADHLDLTASIIADNATAGAVGAPAAGCSVGRLDSHGGSVVEQPSCADPARGDRVVADADLGALVDAGGPTPVRLPRASSPAVGARPSGCPPVDQRGAPRPAGAACAAGAAEPAAPAPPRGLLHPLEPSFPTGGPDAPPRADGVPGPPGLLAVRGARGVVVRGRQAQAVVRNGSAAATGGGLVDLPSPAIDAAIDGTTAWLMHADGMLTAVDIARPAHPVRRTIAYDPVERDLESPMAYSRIAVPAPGVLWRFGWQGRGLRGTAVAFVDVWDVSQPARPRRLRTVDAGFGVGPNGLAWHGGRIVSAQRTQLGLGYLDRTLTVLDATAPLTPVVAARLPLDGTPSRIALRGRHAWVVVRERDGGAPDGVLAIDVADAARPVVLGWWPEVWDDVVAVPDGVLLRRGDLLAVADVSDPVRPRVVSRATWPTPPASLRATDAAVIARLPDVRDVVVDLTDPAGPRPIDAPAGGALVAGVVGGGEVAAWQGAHGPWRVIDPAAPDAPRFTLPPIGPVGPGGDGATVAAADDVVWRAADSAIEGWSADRPGLPIARLAPGGARAIAAAGGRLWALGDALRRWDVGDPARHSTAISWALPEVDPPIGLTADDGGAVLWSAAGRIWRMAADAPGADAATDPAAAPLPPPVVAAVENVVRAAVDVDVGRLAVLTTRGVTVYDLGGEAPAASLGTLPLPGPPLGLATAGGRAYAVAGDWLAIVDLGGAMPAPIVQVPVPGASGPVAVAGGRLLVAAGMNGLLAFDLAAPAPPGLAPRCGQTWPGARRIAYAAPGADAAALRLDGRTVATATLGTAGAAGPLTFTLALPVGHHIVRVAARRAATPWRLSAPQRLHGDPTLPFDPLGATFDDGGPAGPQGVGDGAGCATLADGWTVAIDAGRAVTVALPVRADIAPAAAVTVTVGDRSARLSGAPGAPGATDAAGELWLFRGTVPAGDGPRIDSTVVVELTAGELQRRWRGRAVARRLWLPWVGATAAGR